MSKRQYDAGLCVSPLGPGDQALEAETHKRNLVAKHDFNKGGAHRDKKKYHRAESKRILKEQLDADT